MASRIDLCNLALLKLGSSTKITSLTDNSVPARALNNCYDLIRKAELRANYWSFSLARASLPASATPPAFGFANAFPLPADFLRLINAGRFSSPPAQADYVNQDATEYVIESGSILTDFGAPLQIRYVRDTTDEGTFDALFVVALATRLALECCEQITNSNTKKQALGQDYRATMMQAMRANAIEKPSVAIADDSWMTVRL